MAWLSLLVANAFKFYRLSRPEKRVLAMAGLLLPLLTLGLHWLGFRRLHLILSRIPLAPAKGSLEALMSQAQAVAWAVRVAASYVPCRSNCLSQSLALWHLLRRLSIDSDLRFGVDPKDGELKAHAWVEFKGLVLNDRDDVSQRFAPFPRAVTPF